MDLSDTLQDLDVFYFEQHITVGVEGTAPTLLGESHQLLSMC